MDEKKTNTLEDSLKKLKEIGIKKISVDTHITESNIEAILKREFDKLNPTKAIGFAKILEREYGVDLSEWKKEFKAYRDQIKKEQEKIFVAVNEEEEKEKSGKFLLIIGIVALIIIAYGTYMFLNSHSSQNTSKIPKSNISKENKILKPEIEKQESKIHLNSELNKSSLKETNQTESVETNKTNISIKEQNKTQNMETNETIKTNENNQTSSKLIHESFILSPRSRIWVGVIYLDNFKRKQFLTDQNITLDPKRDFLIVTGHGKFDIFIDKEKYHYDDPLKVRLLYKDQSLEKIDANIFKTLNRGKSW